MAEPETLSPADEPLTLLEETVLLVLARGEFLAPIGRYGDVLQRLTQIGLAERKDAANYVVTARGRQVAEAKDDQFVRSWIDDSNRAALSRRGLPVKVDEGSGLLTGDFDRLTGSPVNETFIGDERRRETVSLPAPRGCVCPPTSEQTCQNPLCPRKAPAR